MPQRARFEGLIEELSARADLQITAAEVGAPASDAEVATARRYASHHLPPGLEELSREMNGFHLEWEGADGDRGAINLLPIERIFGSWEGAVWFPDDPARRFSDLFPFDFFQPEVCVAFRKPADALPDPDIHLHVLGEASYSLGCSFVDYIDLMLEARGYTHWQQTLAPETQRNPEVVQFRSRAPVLFPSLRLERFRP
jgi:hypothetical protein